MRNPSLRLSVAILACLAFSSHAATLTRTSAFDYDASSGLLTKEIIEPGSSNLCLVTEYSYDAYGNKTAATTRNCNGAAGSVPGSNSESAAPSGDAVIQSRTTSNGYDARGQFATSSTNALNQSETKAFDARFGAVTSLTGPNSLTTTWSYDNFGRKTLETRADGTQTRWEYLYCSGINGGTASCPTIGGAAGAYVIVTTPLASNGSTQNGVASKTYYDALDRVIRTETQGFDASSSTAIYQDTQYDNLGRPYLKSRPYYSGQSAYWTTISYDVLSRVIQVVEADNATTTTAYNGLTVTVTNPNNQARITTKNSQGQIVSVKDANNQLLTFEYDPFGNLASSTDPTGNVTGLTYDLRGRKTQMNDPDMGQWTYAYNAVGELVRQTDAKNQVTLIAYDKLGRMTSRSESDLIANWYYDAYEGGGSCAKGIGKLCQAETDTGYNRTHSYDSLGRPSQTTTTISSAYITSVTYDANGRIATQTYPGGVAVRYIYTTLGYLQEIRDNSTNALYWQANSLDAQGHLLLQSYGNGVATQQTYNAANGRLTAIVAGSGNGVQNLSYTYDTLGNIASRSDANQSLTESFLYDSLNRLTSATVNSSGAGIVTTTYSYNALGNITYRSDVGSYSYPASGTNSVRPHAVSRIDLASGEYRTYSFDANGNLYSEAQYDVEDSYLGGRTETYTSFNMPNAFGASGISAAYQYGPEHQRITENSSANGTTIYLNPGNNGELLYEKQTKTDNTIEQRSYLTAYGMVVAAVKQVTQGGTTTTLVRYFHRDNLGSTTAVTNESGTVIERLAYEPFGKRRFASGVVDPNNTIAGINTERGFTNHEHIDELGLIHMNGRIYDPWIGRFVSADPNIQDPYNLQSYNRYSYVLNNPLFYTDPSGYSFWTRLRDTAIRVAAAILDVETGCYGCFSTAVGAYQGARHGGGIEGAFVGGIRGFASFYMADNFPMTDQLGKINWQNVAYNAGANAAGGCAGAVATGGDCSSGAVVGTIGTVGAAYGFMGSIIAGCAAGKISGVGCREGAADAFETYAVSRAVTYMIESQRTKTDEQAQAANANQALTGNEATYRTPEDADPVLLAASTDPSCAGTPHLICGGGMGGGGGGGGGYASGGSIGGGRGLAANPFQGRSPQEIDQVFRTRGFKVSGDDPLNGMGGYVNPRTGRSYHLDPNNRYKEPPHVDVNRLRDYEGSLEKRKYDMGQ